MKWRIKIGEEYGMHGSEVRTEFWWENLNVTHRLEDLGIDWMIIL
jgi:hypothetical protein